MIPNDCEHALAKNSTLPPGFYLTSHGGILPDSDYASDDFAMRVEIEFDLTIPLAMTRQVDREGRTIRKTELAF